MPTGVSLLNVSSALKQNTSKPDFIISPPEPHLLSPNLWEGRNIICGIFARYKVSENAGKMLTQPVCRTEIRERLGENSINLHSEMYLYEILHEEPGSGLLQVCIPNSSTTAPYPSSPGMCWMNEQMLQISCVLVSKYVLTQAKATHKRIQRQRTPGNLLMSMKQIFINGILLS